MRAPLDVKTLLWAFMGVANLRLIGNWFSRLHSTRSSAPETFGLEVKIHCATNGVLSAAQRKFVVSHFTGVNISFDGPASIQDRQRPLANGKRSFAQVMRTLKYFREARFPFGIRVTLTAQEGHRLSEIVGFIHEQCPQLDQLHVEPVWLCGRCRMSGESPPAEKDFIAYFAEAYKLARQLGFSLFYSGARLDALTNKFCAAPGEGFSVTPDGIITSCFEVTDPADARADSITTAIMNRSGRRSRSIMIAWPDCGACGWRTSAIARIVSANGIAPATALPKPCRDCIRMTTSAAHAAI